MNQEQKQEQAYWAYQAKQENLQRMVDKGWVDREEYNKLVAWENKQSKIKKLKKVAEWVGVVLLGITFGVMFAWGF